MIVAGTRVVTGDGAKWGIQDQQELVMDGMQSVTERGGSECVEHL